MALVESDDVKMPWEKSGWLAIKGKGGKKGTFVFATQHYDSTVVEGGVDVFFSDTEAYVWDESGASGGDIDLWSMEELKGFVKSSYDGSFPSNYNQFTPIKPSEDDECDAELLEKYGLTEHKDDIEARVKDLEHLGYETVFKMG